MSGYISIQNVSETFYASMGTIKINIVLSRILFTYIVKNKIYEIGVCKVYPYQHFVGSTSQVLMELKYLMC